MQTAPQTAQKAPRNNALPAVRRHYSTEEYSGFLLNRPQTIRAGYCRDGHYLGLVPLKLPNRRLLWPADEVDALIAGRPAKTPDAADLDKHFQRKAADGPKIPAHIARKAATKRLTSGEVAA